ncbi:hypothetical protein YC2023_113531 [Brassica napus]
MSFDSVHLLSLSLSLHGERKNIGLCNSQEEGCDCALTVRKRDVEIEKVYVKSDGRVEKEDGFVQSRLKKLMRFIEHKEVDIPKEQQETYQSP